MLILRPHAVLISGLTLMSVHLYGNVALTLVSLGLQAMLGLQARLGSF